MDVITDQNWVLSVGTFLPLVGVALMLFIPRGEEALHKQIALLTAAATFAMGVVTLFLFDYGVPGNIAYVSTANREDMIKAIREWLGRVED